MVWSTPKAPSAVPGVDYVLFIYLFFFFNECQHDTMLCFIPLLSLSQQCELLRQR